MEDNKGKGTKAQKDVQEILLSGSKDERKALLKVLEENKNISILEKKVYSCLIQYKNKKYHRAKDLIEELIFDIGGLQEQQQAKVYLLKAQIYENLQGTGNLFEKEIQGSLDKCYQIFRNKRFNQIQYDVHHYLIQIADMQIRQKNYEEAEQIYSLIFNQKDNCRYPNDWAILIEAFLRYFDSRLKRSKTVDSQKFQECVKIMKERYLDKNNIHKTYFYQGIDCLLRKQTQKDQFVQFLRQSEESYKIKNKIKKNKKMINFVDQFIAVDNSPGAKIIKMIPIFLTLGKQFKEIVKNRLILLNQNQKEWEIKRIKNEEMHNERRNDLLNEIYSKHDQQQEIKDKITNLKNDQLKLEEQKQLQKQTLIEQKDFKLKIEEKKQQILQEEVKLKQIGQEKQKFVNELQKNQEAFQPEQFNIFQIFENSKQNELNVDCQQESLYDRSQEKVQDSLQLSVEDISQESVEDISQESVEDSSQESVEDSSQESIEDSQQERVEDSSQENEQRSFIRKYTLDQKLLQEITDLSQNKKQNDYQNGSQENIQENNNQQSNQENKQKNNQDINQENNHEINQKNNQGNQQDDQKEITQIQQYCCFELIQLEEFGIAQQILQEIKLNQDKFQNIIQALLSLLLFSNIPYEKGSKLIYDWMLQFDKINSDNQVPQVQNQNQNVQSLKTSDIGIQEIQHIIFMMYKCIQNTEKMINATKLIIYKKDEQGCLQYLIEDIKGFRFYDPHVYEFKNIIYEILYQIKGKNSQVIMFDGSTYADILNKYKNSWKLKE